MAGDDSRITGSAQVGGANTYTAHNNFSDGRIRLPEATFASPPATPVTGQEFLFTDATAAGTCSGGGSAFALCRYSGSAWQAIGGGGGAATKRILLPGAAAVCASGVVAGSGWSTGASGAPTASCSADGFSGYLAFAVGSANYAYAMVPLPADWTGTLNIDVRAWSTGTTSQTLATDHYCVHVNTNTVSGGTFANTANVSMTMRASSYLSTGTAALDVTGCAAGDEYRMRLSMTASTTAFNLVRALVTE